MTARGLFTAWSAAHMAFITRPDPAAVAELLERHAAAVRSIGTGDAAEAEIAWYRGHISALIAQMRATA